MPNSHLIDTIRRAVAEAKYSGTSKAAIEFYAKEGNIGLADVLLAIGEQDDGGYVNVQSDGTFFHALAIPAETNAKWNLRNTLEYQDTPTLKFLVSLLAVTEKK